MDRSDPKRCGCTAACKIDGGPVPCPPRRTDSGEHEHETQTEWLRCPECQGLAPAAANAVERSVEADKKLVSLELPAGAIQLLYDVLGHFPHAPGTWSQDARARCSIALYDARAGR